MMMYEFIREVLGETGVLVRSCSKKVFSTRYGYYYIGFRCMSRVGPKSDGRKTPRN
jgi:hypothetical protein